MEIKNAEVLKEMVKKYNDEIANEKAKAVEKIVHDLIENELVPLAQIGKTFAYINCGEYKYEVINKLREFNYATETHGRNEIYIRWC